MILQWLDIQEIALALIDAHPQQDPTTVRFTDLREWILHLENFNDDPEHCSERILEAVQQCWIEEM